MKEIIFKDKNEEAYFILKSLAKKQEEFDKKKKELKKVQGEARSLAQTIPNELRKYYSRVR